MGGYEGLQVLRGAAKELYNLSDDNVDAFLIMVMDAEDPEASDAIDDILKRRMPLRDLRKKYPHLMWITDEMITQSES